MSKQYDVPFTETSVSYSGTTDLDHPPSTILTPSDHQPTNLDDERIDYTNALLKERKKRLEVLSRLAASGKVKLQFDKIQTGFVQQVDDSQFKQLDHKLQNELIFDVLPSFEMYRAFQFTPSKDSAESSSHYEEPPNYTNPQNDSGSDSEPFTDGSSTRLTTPASALSESTANSPPAGSFEEFESSYADKVHTLPHADFKKLEVSINVTKDAPIDTKKSYEKEALLKEYTSGDIVHGNVIIHNTSDKPIQFQMFHVTLEGYITIVDKDNKKQFIKRFLRMVDMSASWSHGCVSPAANISFDPLSKDEEGCVLGLRYDRIIEAHTKHKKFFAFKFPYSLLDNVCRHQREVHSLLPPSFGVDRVKSNGKFSRIPFSPALNYGHLGTHGSPILTNDISEAKLCVSYSINAKVIGSSRKIPTALCVWKEEEYALRFIPFGFAVPLFSSKKYLDSMVQSIEHGFEMASRALKLKVEGKLDEVRRFDLEIKHRQLRVSSNDYAGNQTQSFPLRNKSFGGSDFSKVEAHLKYLYPRSTTSFLTSRVKTNQTGITKSGLIKISTTIPKDGLPYKSPKLLKKINEVSNLSETGLKNYDVLSSSLSMTEKQKLTKLRLHLNFTPSDNSLEVSPPPIKFVKTTLLVFNIYSSSPIPIKLSQDLFLEEKNLEQLKSKFDGYYKAFTELQSELKSNSIAINSYLDDSILQDIISMKDLQVDKFSIQAFDSSIDESTWKLSNKAEDRRIWERDITLSLTFKEKMSETLIPNFQSCILSRVYSIGVEFGFKNGQSCELFVPIRIRKFDDL